MVLGGFRSVHVLGAYDSIISNYPVVNAQVRRSIRSPSERSLQLYRLLTYLVPYFQPF